MEFSGFARIPKDLRGFYKDFSGFILISRVFVWSLMVFTRIKYKMFFDSGISGIFLYRGDYEAKNSE